MLEASLEGLIKVFVWPNFSLMIMSAIIGMIIGFIPGIGGNFMLAILIPFVFGMDPFAAIALLLGGHAVTHTGGAITSILFNTPGNGPNAATCFDGFPMAKKGEAGRALGIAMTASSLGGIFGAIVMLALIPVVRPIVMAFGPPEFFMMVMVGIAAIAFLGGKSPAKGMAMGALGLLLSMVGQDPSTGVVRFGFGSLYLWDGINQIVVVIGIFAVGEMINMARQGGSIADQMTDVKVTGGVMTGVFDVFRNWWLMLRCSVIGVIIGMVPGLGGEAAGFFAYGHAVQTSKTPDKFGTGMIEGLVAPESAHNSKEGGALIPTIAFGVPGSSGMAILLGAFLVLGITPGPKMLTEHLGLVFNMAWTVAVANIFGAVLGLATARHMAKLTYIRNSIIVPLVLLFGVLGGYEAHNNIMDVVVVMVFGVMGYYMSKHSYPKAPLILGLVLGRLAEVNLNMAYDLYGLGFLFRPITFVLFLIFLFTIFAPLVKSIIAMRKGGAANAGAA